MAMASHCLRTSAVGPEARPAPLYAAAGQSISYLDLKDMGPPPEPSARCHHVCVCVCVCVCACLCLMHLPQVRAVSQQLRGGHSRFSPRPHANPTCSALLRPAPSSLPRSVCHRQLQSCQRARHVAGAPHLCFPICRVLQPETLRCSAAPAWITRPTRQPQVTGRLKLWAREEAA